VVSLTRTFDSFRQGGLERLLHKGRGKGTPSRLRAQAAAAWRQKLAAGGWRRAAEAQRWLADTHGIVVGLATVYKYLKKLGARLKVPRPCHEKHDPAAAAAFKASLAQQLSDLKLPANRPVRLWGADEMRYGLLPVTRRVWTVPRHVVSWERGWYGDELFGGHWHVGPGVIWQGHGVKA
jgi:transposase